MKKRTDRQSTDQMRSQKLEEKQARAKEKAPREVKVKDSIPLTANVAFVEKRDTTKHNAPEDGTSQRVYLAVGAEEKARPTGKESRKERAPRASAKA